MIDFHSLPVWANVGIFALGAWLIWRAGFRLSIYGDEIAERKELGRAFVGALLLGIATSLPEIATTITASSIGNATLAVNNLMGGVATQIVVLAFVDLLFVQGALTFFSPKPVLLMSGVFLILQITLVLAAVTIGEIAFVAGVGFWPILLMAVYAASMYFLYNYERRDRWAPVDIPDELHDRGDVSESDISSLGEKSSMRRLYLKFLANAAIVFIAGWAVSTAGDALAEQTGLGSSFVGVTLVAIATSLPEISTTIGAVKVGAYTMAVANIFGTNSLECGLLLVSDLAYREGPIMEAFDRSAQFAAILGIVLTCFYLWGLLERKDKTILGMGIDSFLVLLGWIIGTILLYQLR